MKLANVKFSEYNRFSTDFDKQESQLITYDKDLITVAVYHIDEPIGDKEIIVDKETALMMQRLSSNRKIVTTSKKVTITSDEGTFTSDLIAKEASPNVDSMLEKHEEDVWQIESDIRRLLLAGGCAETKEITPTLAGVIISKNGDIESTNRAIIYSEYKDATREEQISLPLSAIAIARDAGLNKIKIWAKKTVADIVSDEWTDGVPECKIVTRLNAGAIPNLLPIIQSAKAHIVNKITLDSNMLLSKLKFFNADITRLVIGNSVISGKLGKFAFTLPCILDHPAEVKVSFNTKLLIAFLTIANGGNVSIDLAAKDAIIHQNMRDDINTFVMLVPLRVA